MNLGHPLSLSAFLLSSFAVASVEKQVIAPQKTEVIVDCDIEISGRNESVLITRDTHALSTSLTVIFTHNDQVSVDDGFESLYGFIQLPGRKKPLESILKACP